MWLATVFVLSDSPRAISWLLLPLGSCLKISSSRCVRGGTDCHGGIAAALTGMSSSRSQRSDTPRTRSSGLRPAGRIPWRRGGRRAPGVSGARLGRYDDPSPACPPSPEIGDEEGTHRRWIPRPGLVSPRAFGELTSEGFCMRRRVAVTARVPPRRQRSLSARQFSWGSSLSAWRATIGGRVHARWSMRGLKTPSGRACQRLQLTGPVAATRPRWLPLSALAGTVAVMAKRASQSSAVGRPGCQAHAHRHSHL